MVLTLPGDPTTRDGFREFCLRQLGKPVIEINVADEQCDDAINIALKWWWDYHFEGSEKTYFKYQLLQADFTNKYITLPDNILGVVNIFDAGTGFGTENMFNIRYQIALNDLYTLSSVSVVPYYMAIQHLQLLEEILVGKYPIRYNRYMNRCYLDTDWTQFQVGNYVILEAYNVVDPTVWTTAWTDRWFQKYATALIKKQWGNNLKKFSGMTMPGGIQFNGQTIYNEAVTEIEEIEHEVLNSYSLPCGPQIG